MKEFDLIIIGSGPGGYVGAIRASQLGLKTAVIEKSKTFGGTCLNIGCIPSKALLESSHNFVLAKNDLRSHGVCINNIKLDIKTMMNRKNKIVSNLTKGIDFLFRKNNITVFKGTGSIRSNSEVEVKQNTGDHIVKAKNILLATGSVSVVPSFAVWDGNTVVCSTEALSFSYPPKHLVVVGGGYIGLELGSVWNRLGSRVTVIEYGSSICASMDKDMQKSLLEVLKKQGMHFHLESQVESVTVKNNTAKVIFRYKTELNSITSDKVLICVGRKAMTQDLGLENVGIKTNALGQIAVDRNFKTSVENIFAIGDLIPGPMLAHKAEEEGVAVAEFIATSFCHVNYQTIPSVIYTYPEVASVGQTEQQLIESKTSYLVGKFSFLANARAKTIGFDQGFIKVLAHKTTDEILGVHILGPRAGDLIAEAVVAMEFKATSEDLARSFHAHPTLSEALREASLGVRGQIRQS